MKDMIDKYNFYLSSELKYDNKECAHKTPTTINEQFKVAFASDAYYNTNNSAYFNAFKLKDNHVFKLFYSETKDAFAVKVLLTFYDLNMNKIEGSDFIEIGDL